LKEHEACPAARVLIVDDSALYRRLLTSIFAADHRFDVIGVAGNGREALDMARRLRPNLITLDVEMPVMSGPECLEALMAEIPTPVLMVSNLTHEGSDAAFACLQRGAVDVVLKPQAQPGADITAFATDVVARAAAVASAQVSAIHFRPRLDPVPARKQPESESGAQPRDGRPVGPGTPVVAIASSTGGPKALLELVPKLSAGLDAAFILVQHLPAGFSQRLAERLDKTCSITVREAGDGDCLSRGVAIVAPGGCHLELDARRRVVLSQNPPLWGVRPAANVTLSSVASRFGDRTIGVVLTGMGRDGAVGAKAIRAAGGMVLAQDEESSLVYGMPRAVADAGAANRIVSLSGMASAIAEAVEAILLRRAA